LIKVICHDVARNVLAGGLYRGDSAAAGDAGQAGAAVQARLEGHQRVLQAGAYTRPLSSST
jgi:hypothetical protein